MLTEYEEAVSRLYSTYANKFPSHEEFWSNLALERIDHARWIYQLGVKINEGSAAFNSERFTIKAIQMSIDYLKDQLTNVQKKEVLLINALSIALNIERSMEGKFSKAFKGYSKDAKRIVDDLSKSVENHYNKIEKVWAAHRKFS